MPEAPTSSEQIPERPVIKVKYNEPFSIPSPKLIRPVLKAEELTPEFEVRNSTIFNIKVEGHPGYPVEAIRGHSVDRGITTTIDGSIALHPRVDLSTNPISLSRQGIKIKYFSPFGPMEIVNRIEVDEEGNAVVSAINTPFAMRIRLKDIWRATEGKDPTRVFLIHNSKTIEGIATRFDRYGRGEDNNLVVRENSWVDFGERLDRNLKPDRQLLIPFDPIFFQTAKILIGDRPPETA